MRSIHTWRVLAATIAIVAAVCLPAYSQNGTPQQTTNCTPQQDDAEAKRFSEADAEKLMGTIADGLIGHNPDKLLSAFDAEHMNDYPGFASQIRTFFELYENFRVHYQVLSVSTSKCGQEVVGRASVEFALEGDDAHNQVPGVTRTGEMGLTCRFDGRNDWKITEINRGFFR